MQSLHCEICSSHGGEGVDVGLMGFRAEDGDSMFLQNAGMYSRSSLIQTNWDSGMFGLVNFRINLVLQNTRGGGGRVSTR
jgi:hypothetical protein